MSKSPATSNGGPLFYREPLPLSAHAHGHWRLRDGNYHFAAGTNAVPVMYSEFTAAMRHYPLVFAGDAATPVAVLGLEGRNLFVADGCWAPGLYVPAYARRYPFLSMAIESAENFVLAIDGTSDRILTDKDQSEGVALFEDAAPSAFTRQMLGFCEAFRNDHATTLAWAAALKAAGILDSRQAAVTLPDGRKLTFGGFHVVDAQKLAALEDSVILDWHRKGWLGWIHLHLASLDRFTDLLERQGRTDGPGANAAQAEAA
jgi:SapC